MNATQIQVGGKASAARAERQLESGRAFLKRAGIELKPGLYANAERLLRGAVSAFDVLDIRDRLAVSQAALAECYRRQGKYAEARTVLLIALADLPPDLDGERVRLTVTLCQVERSDGKLQRAKELAEGIDPLVEALGDPLHLAHFHSEYANILKPLGEIDKAILEYTAASISFEEIGHDSHLAATDNNLGDLLVTVGRPAEARPYLNRAQRYYEKINNRSALGQVCETRARSFAATGDLPAAEDAARESILHLEGGEERGVLAESYKTLADILGAQGKTEEADEARSRASNLLRPVSKLRLVKSIAPNNASATTDVLADIDSCAVEPFEMPDESLCGMGIHTGDQLLVAGVDVVDGDLAVVESKGEKFVGVYFKRQDCFGRKNCVLLEADNEAFEDLCFDGKTCVPVGKVMAFIKADQADENDPEIHLI